MGHVIFEITLPFVEKRLQEQRDYIATWHKVRGKMYLKPAWFQLAKMIDYKNTLLKGYKILVTMPKSGIPIVNTIFKR